MEKRDVRFKVHSWDPWVAQRFGACLWPRARSWRPGIESHIGLPVHGACFSLCLCLCLSLSLCVTIINKLKKKKHYIRNQHLGAECAHNCWHVIVSRSAQPTELEKYILITHVCTHIQKHTYVMQTFLYISTSVYMYV